MSSSQGGKLQLLITRSCRLTSFLGRQGHIGGEQAGEHHPCQLRAMLIVKALQMERQVRRLEARQRAPPSCAPACRADDPGPGGHP